MAFVSEYGAVQSTQQNKNFVALEEENTADRSYKAADVLLIKQLYYFDKGFAIGLSLIHICRGGLWADEGIGPYM